MRDVLPVMIGYDPRQAINFHVCAASAVRHSSARLAIVPLVLAQLPVTRIGLTPFTYSRFLTPWLCDFSGWAVFLDADVAVLGDLGELLALRDPACAVQVVSTTPKYERSAVMLFNCAHEDNRILTPDYVQHTADPLHICEWTKAIGFLPSEWQFLCGYDRKPFPDYRPQIAHYTSGTPASPETADTDYAGEWQAEWRAMNSIIPWAELMGRSNHVAMVAGRPVPRYKVEREARAAGGGSDASNSSGAGSELHGEVRG